MPEEQAVLHTLYKGKNPPSASISGMIPLNMVRPGQKYPYIPFAGRTKQGVFWKALGLSRTLLLP